MTSEPHEELEEYGDPGIATKDEPIPGWLKVSYLVWPIWGILCFYFFWNGSYGWLDRGYWEQLQEAANTTIPYVNAADPSQDISPTGFNASLRSE